MLSSEAHTPRRLSGDPGQAGGGAWGRHRRSEPRRSLTQRSPDGEHHEQPGQNQEESERLIVPSKAGNSPKGTRWREGGAESRTCRRER